MTSPWICGQQCPGKGDVRVDFDANGGAPCTYQNIDSFKQARRYWIMDAVSYANPEELAELTASGIDYFDDEIDDFVSVKGDYGSALMGAQCAEQFLAGVCLKSKDDILNESEVD